jgi:hypothetical protein
MLRAMEAAGETFPSVPTRTQLHLLSLGVVEVHSRPTGMNEIAAIKLYPQGITGPSEPSWSPFLRWVADTLASPRLETHRAKLARTDSVERHFVLGVMPSTAGDVYFALTRHPGVPAEPPELVGGVTHLWVMDCWAERCVAWSPDRGWLDACRNWVTA